MTNKGNWPFLDRLTNDEFLDLLPHLSLEHSFLTQIFLPTNKWIHMLDANFQTLKVYCGCCEEQFGFDTIKIHLTEKNHLKFLHSNIKQFYQPFYTFGKGDIKLARGEQISQERREMALRELNMQMRSFKKDFILAKQFADIVQSETQKSEEDRFLQLSLKLKVEKPEQMFVMVCLPFNDIPKLHFSNAGEKRKPVFSYKYLTKKANLCCNICDIYCSGIGSLNSHLNGFTHKSRQLELSILQYEANSQFNKNCCFYFGDGFTYSVRKDAWKFFGVSTDTLPKLSKEIKKKVIALSEYVSKIFTHSIVNNAIDETRTFECDEYLGHLGVEYVLRIIKNDSDPETKFECGLCEFLGDEKKMQRHILNYDHKKKYLDLHYSDTVKKYESLLGHMRYMKFRAVISEIVDKIAVEVEKQHSRSLPYTVSFYDYKIRRPEIIAEVYTLLHASQNRGPSFSNVLSKDDLQNLKNSAAELVENKPYKTIEYVIFTTSPKDKVYLNQLSHDPVVRLREYNSKMNKNKTAGNGRPITPTNSNINLRNDRSYTRNQDQRSRSRSPITFKPRSSLEQNIWDVYRQEIAASANEIEKDYEGYRKNPESHPLYEEEWNNFWQHRKRELELEGINHRTYNFQPEWVHYFKQRIEKLFGEALRKSQLNVRRKLGIPLDAEEDSRRSHHLNKESNNKRIKEANEFRRRTHVRSFDYKEGLSDEKPFSEEKCGNEITTFTTNKIIIKDNHSNVVHVLRLMTALEEHLGSLGGKIMDLLSNALQMEKHFQGNSVEFEANILTTANCHLLETALEKLKGILYAGLLDDNKISSFDHVIQYTTNLLKYAEKMGWRQDAISLAGTYHCRNNRKDIQEGGPYQMSNEKPLSDTLMDLINVSQTNKESIQAAKELYSFSEICPPPPDIKCSNLNSDLFNACKLQSLNSGLASFDTKLSLDASNPIQKKRLGQLYQTDIGRLNRDSNTGANTLNNNSFKNNNETRTNTKIRTSTGSKVGGIMNNNNGSSLQLRNLQPIPNFVENNAMCQGAGGGNRKQNWSLWNNN